MQLNDGEWLNNRVIREVGMEVVSVCFNLEFPT